jgi:hypothetical protein
MAGDRAWIRGLFADRASTRALWIALGLTVLISVLYLTAGDAGSGYASRSVPLDDVWIHQVYARSIAQGHPFAYNPGEQETGSTSPLWALLLAPAHLLGIPPIAFAKLLGILLTALAAWAGWRLARAFGESWAGMLFAVALPLMPYFAFAAVSGTEVPLFVFLSLLAIEMTLVGRGRAAGVVTGLAILARPEGFLLLGAILAAIGMGEARAGKRARPSLPARAITFAAPALAVIAPWILYCLVATGRPLPATFYAKAHWFGPLCFAQFGRIGALLTSQPFLGSSIGTVVTIPAALIGLAVIVLGTMRCARAGRTALLLVGLSGWFFLYALSMSTPLGEIGPPDVPGSVRNFYFARYLLPGIAPLLLVFALGVGELGRRLSGGGTPGARRAQIAVVAVLVLPIISILAGNVGMRATYSWNCRNIEELQVSAARWVATNIPAGASVGVSDAGAMRYFGGHRIVDLVGLNSHRLLPILRAIERAPWAGPEETRLREQFWRESGPDYLAITNGWHLPLVRKRTFGRLADFRIERNTICGGDEILVVMRQDDNRSKGTAPAIPPSR